MQIQTLREYRECLAQKFSTSLGQIGLPVLDVGCGSGEFLQILRNLGQKVAGIEPSNRLAERARHAGFDVIHDYVRPESLEGRRFGGFTCLQVLEHLDLPVQFLITLRMSLSGDGLGLIEVPSLEKIIEDRRFYDFFGDHLNYFTARTLRMCCESGGFEVIDVERTFAGQFLAATVRPAVSLCPVPASDYFLRSMAEMQKWAAEQVSLGKRMVFWGAGYKSIAAIAELNLDGVKCVVDSDRAKSGRVTPVSHLPIMHPDLVDFSQVDAILLVAMAYRDEIVRQIRGQLQFTGVVVTCGDRLEFL